MRFGLHSADITMDEILAISVRQFAGKLILSMMLSRTGLSVLPGNLCLSISTVSSFVPNTQPYSMRSLAYWRKPYWGMCTLYLFVISTVVKFNFHTYNFL